MGQILSADITNIIIVVVRYYGGTPLGVPGLINAYKTAAAEALNVVTIVEKEEEETFAVTFGYATQGEVIKLLKDKAVNIQSLQMDELCTATITVPKSYVALLQERLTNINGVTITQ